MDRMRGNLNRTAIEFANVEKSVRAHFRAFPRLRIFAVRVHIARMSLCFYFHLGTREATAVAAIISVFLSLSLLLCNATPRDIFDVLMKLVC